MRVKGKEILNFPISEKTKGKFTVDFEINHNKKRFWIDVTEQLLPQFYILKSLDREKVRADFLLCIDQNGIPFTLYDCYIFLAKIPDTKIWIEWSRLLYGQHIEQDQSEKIKFAEYIIELPGRKATYRSFIGKSHFDIFDGKACISTDWNQEGNYFNGVRICVTCKDELYTLDTMQKIILRLMEIYFLEVGFFAEVLRKRMITGTGKEIFYYGNYAAFTRVKERDINLPHVLELKKTIDYSKIFMKWWEIREKKVATFNLFAYTVSDSDFILEVPTATYIQCLEGYFRTHYTKEMMKFPDEAKEQFILVLMNCIDEQKELSDIVQRYGLDQEKIKSSIKGTLGNLNSRSLKELLIYAMEYSTETKKLFEYECATLVNEKNSLWDVFIKKAVGHRNWLSHMGRKKAQFHDEEIELASSKLKLLFRLVLLKDIGAEITESSINTVVKRINYWYRKYTLS